MSDPTVDYELGVAVARWGAERTGRDPALAERVDPALAEAVGRRLRPILESLIDELEQIGLSLTDPKEPR